MHIRLSLLPFFCKIVDVAVASGATEAAAVFGVPRFVRNAGLWRKPLNYTGNKLRIISSHKYSTQICVRISIFDCSFVALRQPTIGRRFRRPACRLHSPRVASCTAPMPTIISLAVGGRRRHHIMHRCNYTNSLMDLHINFILYVRRNCQRTRMYTLVGLRLAGIDRVALHCIMSGRNIKPNFQLKPIGRRFSIPSLQCFLFVCVSRFQCKRDRIVSFRTCYCFCWWLSSFVSSLYFFQFNVNAYFLFLPLLNSFIHLQLC